MAYPRERGTLLELIDRGVMKPNDEVTASRRKSTFSATITSNGLLRLPNGFEGSPSTAATECTGNAVNGWKFWRYRGRYLADWREANV